MMRGHGVRSLTSLGAALILVGCSSSGEVDTSVTEYTEPAWMAEVRAQDEEYTTAMTACLEGQGVHAVATGGDVAVSLPLGDDGRAVPGSDVAADQAQSYCGALIPAQSYLQNSAEVEYAWMLDSQRCIENEGYELPEPPSWEAWRDRGDGRYSPHRHVSEDGSLPTEDFHALIETCPQGGSAKVIMVTAEMTRR